MLVCVCRPINVKCFAHATLASLSTKKFLTNHPEIPHNIIQHVRILAGGAPHSTCLCVRRVANAQEYVRVSPFVEKGASVKRE